MKATGKKRLALPAKLLFSLITTCALTTASYAQHEVDSEEAEAEPIKINGNENAFGSSQMAYAMIMQNLQRINRYAWEETQDLVAAIAAREGVPTDHIIVTAGSGPVLSMTGMWKGLEGGNMIIATPGYQQLARTFEAFGGTVVNVPVTPAPELKHDLDAMEAMINDETQILYICNPNNPTGTIVDPDKLREVASRASEKTLVFIDEAYLELADDFTKNTMVDLVRDGKDVIIARTFSKVYGIAGLRIGYGVAKPEIIKELRKFYQGGPNILGAVAATASLQDPSWYEQSRMMYIETRKMVTDAFNAMGIEYAEPSGSFVFFKTGMPIQQFQAAMEAENILVGRPFPPMFDWCRVSIGTQDEMAAFIEAVKKILDKDAA
ncbi:MAG: histidinol-phosphate aminotransferase family protein [Opitutales bacterium]|nr:histidinol-phosphate aminotransferase family protein [Opitutales bacterium]